MKIHRVEQGYINRRQYTNSIYPTPKAFVRVYGMHNNDIFINNSKTQQVDFTGLPIVEKLMKRYLMQKTYKTSIRGSKRPYLSIDKDLSQDVVELKIPVNPLERIVAWDINPKNSKNYVIFLHGFSQNITNNQPLYKELSKTKFGILAIDYRGYGKNPPSTNINEENITQDVAAAINYLKDKEVENIGIVGHSFGAYIGAKVSKDTNLQFAILVSPMHSLEFWLKNVIKHPKKYKFEMKLIKYIKDFKEQYSKIFDITKHLDGNTTKMYVIQSNNDRYVRTNKVDNIVKQMVNLREYKKIRSGGHRMDESKIKEIRQILDNL